MATATDSTSDRVNECRKPIRLGRWIAMGLLLGVVCGVLFGDYCSFLGIAGQAYVGLLQMTVMPYLVVSLIAKMGRLNGRQARQLGLAVLVVLLLLWLISVLLIVAISLILPTLPGATFYSPVQDQSALAGGDLLERFIPANIFRSLSEEFVPGVVIFCLFFGTALIPVSGKEPLLDFLDICTDGIGRINTFLVRLAPVGLFALIAASAGTLQLDQIALLQAYLIMFVLACLVSAFGVLPLLVSSVTRIRYRAVVRAAQEPVFTAIATGKLFVVLPQIVERCEELLRQENDTLSELDQSTANVVVPLAYPFPHMGKVMAFVFVSFAAWYVGRGLTPIQTFVMSTTGVVSSFASPLISIPFFLDEYKLPQDLMPLFILPGFITTRLADVVGVFHLMTLTLIVSCALQGRIRIRWRRLITGVVVILVGLGIAGTLGRSYLASTTLENDLGKQLLSLEVPSAYEDVVVYLPGDPIAARPSWKGHTLDRVKSERVIRVGYYPDKLPYSFFNQRHELVGLDVELMHHLAASLQVKLEFVPYTGDSVFDQLNRGEIDVAVGGVMMKPTRLLEAEFTQPYATATIGVFLFDNRRGEFETWDKLRRHPGLRLAVGQEDLIAPARRFLPDAEFEVSESMQDFLSRGEEGEADGFLAAAEELAAWNVLYPEYAVVVPRPIVRRPVSLVARSNDAEWIRFLDRWLDFERLDGSFDRLRAYWVEGDGAQPRERRWFVLRDVLHWLP